MPDAAVQEPEITKAPESVETQLAPRAEAPLNRTQAMGFGLAPRNFDEAWRMADVFAKTQFVPKAYQGHPHDILVAMQYGAEIGLPPMASLQSVAVINGKPGVYGDGFLAVIQSTPAYAKHKEFYVRANGEQADSLRQEDYQHDEVKAVAKFWRKGNPDPFVAEFSIGDAKRAKLWGKEGPWQNYPARQMLWRARGFAGRNGFAAELRGVKTVEELADIPPDEPTATTIDAPIVEPMRRSEKLAAGAITDAPSPEAATETTPEPDANPPATVAQTTEPTKAAPIGQVAKGLRITDTKYIPGKDGRPPAYEIHANKGEAGKVGIDQVFVTRDEQLYKLAVSCEDAPTRFDLTWHEAKAETTKKVVKVLTGLTAAD